MLLKSITSFLQTYSITSLSHKPVLSHLFVTLYSNTSMCCHFLLYILSLHLYPVRPILPHKMNFTNLVIYMSWPLSQNKLTIFFFNGVLQMPTRSSM